MFKGIMKSVRKVAKPMMKSAEKDQVGRAMKSPSADSMGRAMKKVMPRMRAEGSGPNGEEMPEKMGRAMGSSNVSGKLAKIKKLQAAAKEKYEPKMRLSEKEMKEVEELMPKMKTGGMAMKSKMADKVGRAMKKTDADAKGRAMSKKTPKKMMGGGMMKGYADGGDVTCGKATRGYGAARKGK